jgi:hypothetical protein
MAPESQHAYKENELIRTKLSQKGREAKEDDATEDTATKDYTANDSAAVKK